MSKLNHITSTNIFSYSLLKLKYIKAIGLEIEGQWLIRNRGQISRFCYDGSVHFNNSGRINDDDYIYNDGNDCGCGDLGCEICYTYDGTVEEAGLIGETRSNPITKVQDLIVYVNDNYPDKTNSTCGLHIHISLKQKNYYSLLMSSKFNTYFKKMIVEYADKNITNKHFWNRLEGSNTFCTDVFRPQIQTNDAGKGSTRYSQLNYCYSLHGTLECRLFPAFKYKDTAINAIMAYLSIVESYIHTNKHELVKTERFVINVGEIMPDNEIEDNEVIKVCV